MDWAWNGEGTLGGTGIKLIVGRLVVGDPEWGIFCAFGSIGSLNIE